MYGLSRPKLTACLDFSECIADGEPVGEALKNGRDALKATIAALKAEGHPVPAANAGFIAQGPGRKETRA